MKVKICGITNVGDALDAVEEGADALGFIFVESSPRYVAPEVASSIIQTLPPFVTPVGVFVNASREAILATMEKTGIRCLQLHGDETPGDVLGYTVPVYKSFRVGNDFDTGVMRMYKTSAYLLDTFVNGQYGGTGQAFDWNIAVRAKRLGRIIVSGGLTAGNVGRAIQEVRPYGIDVNSGIESSPGRKDRRKMQELFRCVQEVVCSL